MNILEPTDENIALAADALRRGLLVAMPTETVYGVAADATNREAVRKVFDLKGRPPENPLIVHVATFEQVLPLVREVPPMARVLADRFWPGPLTLVLPKSDLVPPEVTAGLDTVAIRMPKHPVALSLILAAGRPLAAPSANPFTQLSPTRAEHIDPELAKGIDHVLDGGPCFVGLESTVVDLTMNPPAILRPGGVSRGDIQAALGVPLGQIPSAKMRTSPGMYPRHYAPRVPVRLVECVPPEAAGLVLGPAANAMQIRMPRDAVAYACALYDALHRLDLQEPTTIYVERPDGGPEWEAVVDRLVKASTPG